MKNNLTTTQKTEVVLAKGKNLLGITAKILSGSKALATATTHKDVTIIGDLMWENVANPEEHEMDWYGAMEYAKNLRLGGYDDWRLPTIEELVSVVVKCIWVYDGSYKENYEAKGFASNDYWSSTTDDYNSYYACFIDFNDGSQSEDFKNYSRYVRCVRAGQ